MTVERMIELLEIERECVLRNASGECNRYCAGCDLLQDDTELHEMYTEAIAILKAHEPKVMTLEEVLDLKCDDVVYCEIYPTKFVLSAIVINVIPRIPDIDTGVVQFRHAPTWNGINNADLNYYGKIWRCWTSRPNQATMEATPWN